MSQHHLTVHTTTGRTIKLTAGWDNSMLKRFFLVLRDERRPAPDSDEGWRQEYGGMLYYDSDERGGLYHIGDVERKLEENHIPFSEDHVAAFGPDGKLVTNPNLLPLLCELLQERDGDLPTNRTKHWDNEPLPPVPSSEELAKTAEWDRQYIYRYKLHDPHPVFSPENWKTWLDEQDNVCPYENWVRMQLVDIGLMPVLQAVVASTEGQHNG